MNNHLYVKPGEALKLGFDPDGFLYEYLMKPHEGLANAWEAGYRMGITPKTPYPGAEKVRLMVTEFEKNNPGKAFVTKLMRKDKPRRMWRAFQGKYAVGTGAAATAGVAATASDNDQTK